MKRRSPGLRLPLLVLALLLVAHAHSAAAVGAGVAVASEGASTLHALIAWDSTRQGIVATAKRLESGEMAQAKLRERDLPYMIHYGTSQLATLIRSESEAYGWTPGSQVQSVVGKPSKWGQSPAVIAAPSFSSSKDILKDDVLTWTVPAVDTGSVDFGFEVTATVRWTKGREMANGKTTTNEESSTASGTLVLTARAR